MVLSFKIIWKLNWYVIKVPFSKGSFEIGGILIVFSFSTATCFMTLVPLLYYYMFKIFFFAGLVCKACSYEALSNNHEWSRRSSTDALNNNLRPKSEFSDGSTSSLNKNRKVPVTDIYLNDPFEVGGDGKLHLLISLFYMEFLNNLKKKLI